MLPHHGYPDAEQWLILLQCASPEAEAILQKLRKHTRTVEALASVSSVSSLVDHEAVQRFLASSTVAHGRNQTTLEQHAIPITYLLYPSQRQWSEMLQRDRAKALRFYSDILRQRAYLGLEAPPVIDESITAFRQAQQAQPGHTAHESTAL
jgi:hypothetical protein